MAAQEASLDQQWREHVDRVLLDPARLFVMAALVVSPDFYRLGYLSKCSGVTRNVLARHTRKLRLAGYVESRRGAYQQLWVRATSLGQERFSRHMTAMDETVSQAREFGRAARS